MTKLQQTSSEVVVQIHYFI